MRRRAGARPGRGLAPTPRGWCGRGGAGRAGLAIREQSLGEDHTLTAATRHTIGLVLSMRGEYEQGEIELRRAIDVQIAARGEEHPVVARLRSALAMNLALQQRHQQAEVEYIRGLAALERVLPADNPEVVGVRLNLARVRHDQGRYKEAEEGYREVLARWTESLPEDHPSLSMARYTLAWVLLDQDRAREAVEHAERSWAQRKDRASGAIQGETAFVLARALWESSEQRAQRARALELANKALVAFEHAEDVDPAQIAQVRRWIAEHGDR